MPLGPFGEVVGTTGTLEALGPDAHNYKTRVVAPRNPKLVKQNEPDQHKMTPSKFLFDMSLDTEQKLANTHIMKIPRKTELLDMGDTSLQKFSRVNIDEPMFQPFPSEIYFQNFNPFEIYEVPLVLRNNDKVPRLVKVTQDNSPYFKIISPNDVGHKVGPGLPTTFRVQFMPDEKKDYKHELICITEREKFVVPVMAIGARGILDFPDEINFPTSPVKYQNTKTLLVRNIGSKEAKFSLKAETPFSVTPDIGTLGVKDSIQVTVEFKPLTAGDHKGTLCLTYDTGEEIFITLYGAAQDANVRLDKNSIRIENTYISMANQRTIVITNRSDFIAHFRWTQFATQDDEDQQKLLRQIELDREENSDSDRFLDECVADPTLRDKLAILSRTFQNRKRAVENDPLLFDDDVVSVEPVEGDIWPNSTFEVSVIFKPREATSYTRTAYCDITGRECRLPLRIRGDGAGPKVDFSFNHLDMGNIFIGSKHTYEIIIANKGDIDAIYSVVPNTSIFGPCFAFNPAEGIVMPGGHQAIEVAFRSPYLGDFEETFCFQVDGQPRQCEIKFTGKVVGPTFNFDVVKLKFGTVPFGFQSTQVCHLVNTSLVPMVFNLRVPGDGTNKSVCCTNDIKDDPLGAGPTPVMDPKEFEIVPDHGVIAPQSEIKVTVHLVPNTVKKYEVALVVDVERVGEEIMSLPISAKSMVPEISNLTPVLNYGRCFLRHPYEHRIRLHNDTDLSAKYEIFPQEEVSLNEPPISYQSPKPKGIIAPHSVADVPLLIKANALEEQEVPCLINIFGNQSQPIAVHVMCVGEGPVVHMSPLSVDWGDIPVLTDIKKQFVLSNESFIPARFTAHMLRPNTVFKVDLSEGEIPPEQSMVLTVTANLDDCVRFQDKLQINFLESQSRQIPIQAYGRGTTIVSDPPLGPVLDLGPNFSNRLLSKKFRLTNKGRRIQQLVWLTDGYIPMSKAKRDKVRQSNYDIRKRVSKPTVPNDVPQPIFRLTPNRMELNPGESIDLNIEGFVDGPQNVSEKIVCHAIIGRAGGKTPIISVDVKAEFIEPLLNFSTKCAFFRVDKAPADELTVQQKQLIMNNVSSLPLNIGLKLAYPFSMVIGDEKVYETEVCLKPEDVYYLVIEFDPKFKDDCHIRTIDEVLHITYKEHPHVDYVALRGEVYFPNLEFEKTVVDFGCILNDTEVTRYINITNTSPMEVRYHWSFLVGDVPTTVKKIQRPRQQAFDKETQVEKGETAVVVKEELPLTGRQDDLGLEITGGRDTEEERQKPEEVTVQVSNRSQNALEDDEGIDQEVDENKKGSRPETPIDMDLPEKGQLDTEKEKEDDRSSSMSRLSLLQDEEEALRSNKILTALLEEEETSTPVIGVEEVFDILPLYGTLQPGDTEQVTFTFYGHADIWGEVRAVCEVEGGPTYELKMTGQASLVEYDFDSKNIDFGKIMYDHVATSTITLINTGKVGFEFAAINMDPAQQKRPYPGVPVMVPHSGYIEPFAEQKIEVKFLPGVPENFNKSFQIQVAHFKPDYINVFGEGVFPRVSLDLPRLYDEEGVYAALVKEARENLLCSFQKQAEEKIAQQVEQEDIEEELMKLTNVDENGDDLVEGAAKEPPPPIPEAQDQPRFSKRFDIGRFSLAMASEAGHGLSGMEFSNPDNPVQPKSMIAVADKEASHKPVHKIEKAIRATIHEEREPTELEMQMEIERLAVRDFAQERLNDPEVQNTYSSVNEKGENLLQPGISHLTITTSDSYTSTKPKPLLPHYVLDFGYVVLGTVRTHIVRATNTGWFPVSFKLERRNIQAAGFHIELDRVRNLPGAPDNETLDFLVSFDPRGANLHLGAVEIVVPINIVGGPLIMMLLRAHVTMPDLEVSDDVLEFGNVKCGECKVITIQLHNHQKVRCDWDSTIVDDKRQIEKHVPMHLRRKIRQGKRKPRIFEVLPPTGCLMPGQRCNVQVKFMPTEEKYYENRIPIRIAQSSQRILLLCHGQGLEPRLDFERTLVEFGPILPHSAGDEQEIIVRNPCSFPIEFYSLENDIAYLEEERVLRLMRGYDEYNTLLLPPRGIGEKLPHELQEFYDEQLKKLEEEEKAKAEREAREEMERREREEREREEREAELLQEEPEDRKVEAKTEENAPAITTTGPTREHTPPQEVSVGIVAAELTMDDAAKREDLLEERMIESIASGPGVGELEITPVSAAIARHLGIDLTPEGKAARNRRGIAIIVQGPPLSGKTTTAVALAKYYEAALLTVDGVVCDAIANGNTPAGLRARELCSETARTKAQELKEMDGQEGDKKPGGLSVEALTAHTQGTAGQPGASQAGGRKVSSMMEQKSKQAVGGKNTVVNSSIEGATGSQVPSSPPPLTAPIARRLSISASVAGEEGLISCVLPEDLLVEILADRLQLNDCHRGVVFDGLETLFSQTSLTTANAILKALNNRRFIYFLTLKLDYNVLKEQEKKAQEQKALEEKQKEEEEIRWLEEMDEDEYDALSDEMKARVDLKRLVIKKERIKREQEEKAERERIEREAREEEERRKEEEMKSRKGRKGKTPAAGDLKEKEKKTQTAGAKGQGQASDRTQKSQGGKGHDGGSGSDRPESHATEKSDTQMDEAKKKKEKTGKKDIKKECPDTMSTGEEVKDPVKEAELLLMQRFRTFEAAQKDIQELLEFWDRSTLQPKRPVTPSERSEEEHKDHPASGKKGKKDKSDKEKQKEQERLRQEKELAEKAAKEAAQGDEETVDGAEAEEEKKDEIGVPNIIIDCVEKVFVIPSKIIESEALPSVAEEDHENPYLLMTFAEMAIASGKLPDRDLVLDGLGLGPQGPPIPPPASFAVVPYPVKRRPPLIPDAGGRYVFVASSPDDPNIGQEQKEKEAEGEEDLAGTPEKGKDDTTPTKGKGGRGSEKGRTSTEGRGDRKRSAERKKLMRRNSAQAQSPPPGLTTPVSDGDNVSRPTTRGASQEGHRLTVFRWTVPAGGEVTLKLRFTSDELGQFDQTLNFEIVGTRRRYQMFCRGICAFPTISKEPRIVFPSRKKNRRSDEIIHKKYILMTETFEFGPLLVGKSREKYREGKYPENMESFTVLNTSPLEADISFCFLNDSKAETYLLEPPTMTLKPGESNKLVVWAYPKGPGHYEDAVVCCVRENPEPIVFKVCCDAFRPELELDKKQLHFDRVLLHRKDTKTIYLRNSTQLPVAWKLSGLENLGDDFTVAADSGIVEPLSEYPLQAYFRAMKAVQTSKKMIRIEIADADNIMGVVHTEPIQVIAEAYDVALDMSFPKDPPKRVPAYAVEMRGSLGGRTSVLGASKVSGKMSAQPGKPTKTGSPLPTYHGPSSSKTQIVDDGMLSTPAPGRKPPSKRASEAVSPADSEADKKLVQQQILKKPLPTGPTFSLMNPRGTDGGLDFGTIKVNEETKQTCTLKNKGKYEIAYNFLLENVDPKNPDVKSLFSVIPNSGKLSPLDRPTQVQVIFKSSREVVVKDQQILKCQVIEPSLGEQGEIIASIPVKVSVKAVFSKFNITPMNDINFGALLVNSKKTRTFTIENKGEFDFKYTISKKEKETNMPMIRHPRGGGRGDKNSKSRDDTSSAPSVKPKKADSVRQDAGSGQSKLTLGMFTIFPAFGIILPNGSQVITVDCVGENQGKETQEISIDITERDPATFKGGVPYKLVAEACIPSINVDDIGSIFEEHRVCKNLSIWQHNQCGNAEIGGVFGEEERKFVFNNVIVGRRAKARFKISNNNKVPCDVVFTLKPVTQKGAPKSQDVFDLDPPRMQIPNHSHIYATVTFTPPSMQSYSAIFEAAIEGATPNQVRGKSLTFEVSGEGNLPRITIAKPTVRNKRGQPLLLFKRILLGRSESLPFELVNDGTLPSKVDIDLLDPDSAFMLKPTKETKAAIGDIDYEDRETRRRPHTSSVIVNPNEMATFEVVYRPLAPRRSQANLKVSVIDNQYEDSVIQMVGEGYEDDITLDNIGTVVVPIDPEKELGSMAEDDVSAAKPNLMQFGDCYISESRTLNLTMANHSKTDCVRFQWPEHPQLKFSPQIGHLHASCTKDVAVTFNADAPITFAECPIQCRIAKINFDKPLEQVCDWDDKIQVVKWVDIPPSPVQTADSKGKGVGSANAIDKTPALNTESIEEIMEVLLFGSKSNLPATPRPHRPGKKKMIETEAEPPFTEVPDTVRNVELLASAISDFTQCSCKVSSVHFKDTLMFQTRVYSITVSNEGQVALEYNWQVVMDSFVPMMQRSVTFMSEGERPESRVDVVDTSYIPFSVSPEYGAIPAGKSAVFVVKFAPLDVNDYEGRLICCIPHMGKEEQGPVIGLKGRSLMPYCHFELEDSDYISSARRNPELRGPGGAPPGSTLDPNTRVIEFNVCGIGVKSYKDFGIVNPTNQPFDFEWICEDEFDPKRPSCFRCLHSEGDIRSGRKFKIGFEFVSNELDVVESFWKFVIPSQAISLPFLLVGNTREPDVCLDRSHLNFRALLVGREAKETVYMTNKENTYFNFSFVENSCHSEGYASHLKVEPMHGQISANSTVPINLYFSPTSEKEVNFNLRCTVHRKVAPITLNVKAEGYSMNSVLLCEDSMGTRVELSERGLNQINFGEVEINENTIRHLFLFNSGKFNFDYSWEINEHSVGADAITISPLKGGVMCGETQQFALSFCPSKRMSMKGCELTLKVANGPSYQISVLGMGITPGLHFSFRTYNFGNCFIQKAGHDIPTKHAILRLTNKDRKEISVDCLYEKSSCLTYKFEASVIARGETVEIPFTFCPQHAKKYHETVMFEINGLSKQKVEFFGIGSEMKIEVADPKNKCVNFGARMLGDNIRKLIPIVNNSPATITFNLALTPTEPGLQQKDVLTISPREPITLTANGGSIKVEVWFRPKARIPQFTEEVLMECAGISMPLFVVKGSCLGMEISLDSDSLSFGTVYQRSSSTRKLVMSNSGDMNSKFRWDIKRFRPDFSIHPVEGYITPGMDVTFDVEFHPQTISGDVRYEKLKCFLDGGPHQPVTLTLTGSCTGIPPVKEVQNFQAIVRQTDTKQLMIPNKSNQLWNLKPVIDGEHWTGPVNFTVEPQQTKGYELTYKPLTMTSENKKHTGSIFFPLPDGSGLLFNLTGTSEAPKAIAKIQRDVPCKTGYTELLTVTNWLKKPQRFRVRTEPLKSDKLDPGTTVKGVEYIDVPANSKKDYKLSFFAHKEGQTIVKVTFSNDASGEYQFYEVTFRATRSGTLGTIPLTTPVRQSVPHTLTMDNPLPYQATFFIACTVPEVLIPSQLAVPAHSQGHFNFEYQPLKVGVVRGRLELSSTDLGMYVYDLVLTATPGAPEKAIYFRTGLGTSVTQVAKFLNFAKQKTDYTCKIENTDFHVDKSVTAAPGSTGGTEVALEVLFEPSKLGEQHAMLTVSSPIGGEYLIPLFGTCIPPKPQGPFMVKAGSTAPIMFRNVFNDTTQFTFQVDNPLFHLTKQGESIRSHKEHRIVVGFDGNDSGSKAAVMGKLIVSCARSAGGNSNVQWVYYLKGFTP